MTETSIEYTVQIANAFLDVLSDPNKSEKVKTIQADALKKVFALLTFYKKRGYMDELISEISKRKIAFVLSVTSKTEMDKVIKPSKSHYNGAQFIPGKYDIPEEELISWSETSFLGPLNHVGHKRYMELFAQVFPDKSKEIVNYTKQE